MMPLTRSVAVLVYAVLVAPATVASTAETVNRVAQEQMQTDASIEQQQLEFADRPTPVTASQQRDGAELDSKRALATHKSTIASFDRHNVGPLVRNPSRFAQTEAERVSALISATCDVRIAPPTGKGDVATGQGTLRCSPEQIQALAQIVSGRQPLPQPPTYLAGTAGGMMLIREIDIYNARMSLVEQVIAGALGPTTDELLTHYTAASASPTIEEINAMSGTGAVQRTALLQAQVKTQIYVQIYKDTLLRSQLLAVRAAQGQARHHAHILDLIRTLSTSAGEH